MEISIQFKSRSEQHSQYDWADISRENDRVGKARCKIDGTTIIVHTITIYPEWEGREYGREFIEYCKDNFQVVVADRVRYSAVGFWIKMGFIDRNDGCWVYQRFIPV